MCVGVNIYVFICVYALERLAAFDSWVSNQDNVTRGGLK